MLPALLISRLTPLPLPPAFSPAQGVMRSERGRHTGFSLQKMLRVNNFQGKSKQET